MVLTAWIIGHTAPMHRIVNSLGCPSVCLRANAIGQRDGSAVLGNEHDHDEDDHGDDGQRIVRLHWYPPQDRFQGSWSTLREDR
jgi:hypothetical protein